MYIRIAIWCTYVENHEIIPLYTYISYNTINTYFAARESHLHTNLISLDVYYLVM